MNKNEIIKSLYETIGNIETMTEEEFREKFEQVNEEYESLKEALTPDDLFPVHPVFPKTMHRNKRYRTLMAKRRLKKLYQETKNIYGVGAWYNSHKGRIIKDSINNKKERQLCNRRFRRRWKNGRYNEVADGGAYRKHEEYWWAVT